MQIEFDRAKDSANQAKHGVSLGLAEELDWDAAPFLPQETGTASDGLHLQPMEVTIIGTEAFTHPN